MEIFFFCFEFSFKHNFFVYVQNKLNLLGQNKLPEFYD